MEVSLIPPFPKLTAVLKIGFIFAVLAPQIGAVPYMFGKFLKESYYPKEIYMFWNF